MSPDIGDTRFIGDIISGVDYQNYRNNLCATDRINSSLIIKSISYDTTIFGPYC